MTWKYILNYAHFFHNKGIFYVQSKNRPITTAQLFAESRKDLSN